MRKRFGISDAEGNPKGFIVIDPSLIHIIVAEPWESLNRSKKEKADGNVLSVQIVLDRSLGVKKNHGPPEQADIIDKERFDNATVIHCYCTIEQAEELSNIALDDQ